MARVTLDDLNRMDPGAFAATLGDVFEHSPWIAEAAYVQRPFATLNALFQAMTQAVRDAGAERQGTLIRSHPDLAGKAAREGAVTAELRARADERRPRSPVRGRICGFPPAQRGLSGEVRHAVRRLRAAARQGIDPSAVRATPAPRCGDGAGGGGGRNPPHRRVAARPAGLGAGSPQSSRAAFDPCARHPSRPSRRGRCKSNFSRSSPQANRA